MFASIEKEMGRGRIKYIYNLAIDYSISQSVDKKWLSRGSGPIEPVVTQSGHVVPGRPSALIVLMGFDGDRIVSMVDSIEPDVLFIGLPRTEDPSRQWISDRIRAISGALKLRVAHVMEFEFDCDSIELTEIALENEVLKIEKNYNIIMVPNNNKISTLACAYMCLKNEDIQIAFAPGLLYNIVGYSTPSDMYMLIGRPSA